MKLMDISALNALSNALNGIDIGESILYGRVEAYSCTSDSPANGAIKGYNPLKCVCSETFRLGFWPSNTHYAASNASYHDCNA